MVSFADYSFMNKQPNECNGGIHSWEYDTPYYRTCRCGRQEFYSEDCWIDVTEKDLIITDC